MYRNQVPTVATSMCERRRLCCSGAACSARRNRSGSVLAQLFFALALVAAFASASEPRAFAQSIDAPQPQNAVAPEAGDATSKPVKGEKTPLIARLIPSSYVSYQQRAEPLSAGLKFTYALKVATSPATLAGVVAVAGIYQAAGTPDWKQDGSGFGKRVGSVAGTQFADVMIGRAILPSLLHQDPRYFCQGAGTTKSRFFHAVASAFVTRGDNGKSQPNYSMLGGSLAAAGIGNLYYPDSNRGAGEVFTNFAFATAGHIGISVAQEFFLVRHKKL